MAKSFRQCCIKSRNLSGARIASMVELIRQAIQIIGVQHILNITKQIGSALTGNGKDGEVRMSEDRHYTQERCELAKCYPGKKWAKKVYEMSDAQVYRALTDIRNRREKERLDRVQKRQACW